MPPPKHIGPHFPETTAVLQAPRARAQGLRCVLEDPVVDEVTDRCEVAHACLVVSFSRGRSLPVYDLSATTTRRFFQGARSSKLEKGMWNTGS